MLCSKCGAGIPAETRFCGKCGQPVASGPKPTPVVPIPDLSGPPRPSKTRLPLAVILVGAVLLLMAAGLVVVFIVRSSNNPRPSDYSPSYADQNQEPPAVPLIPLPTPSKYADRDEDKNLPANAAQSPANYTAISDTLYQQKATGTWRVQRYLDNGIYMDMQAVYLPNGLASWGGTVTAQRQTYYIVMTGFWEIKGGYLNIKITASNIPQIIPSGYYSANRIVVLNNSEWTYVDSQTGGSETAYRVR